MSTLEEQIDVSIPAKVAWEQLHRIDEYPRFVDGVLRAHAYGTNGAHLDGKVGGSEQEFETEIIDHGQGQSMTWQTVNGPQLKGTFTLLPLDPQHTQVQLRLEYDPAKVKETFGGPKGFAQSTAIADAVRADLEHFKDLVEGQRTGVT